MRPYGTRPRRDRDKFWFSVQDEIETETFPRFHETETRTRRLETTSRDRDYIPDVLCANFVKFARPEIGKVVRYLSHKKKIQNFGSLSRSWFCVNRAQNLSGPAPDNILGVPKFQPNPYASGGVIAGRVNIIETRHKVFPILGEASSWSNSTCSSCC